MSTSYQDTFLPSVSTFVCTIGGFPADQLLGTSATLIDVCDASPSTPADSNSDGDLKDATKGYDIRAFGMMLLKSGLVWLLQLVVALFLLTSAVASEIVSLKDRITAVESTPRLVHDLVTEALTRQVGELSEQVASQQDRIAFLESSHLLETNGYEKTIQELTTKIDSDLKTRDDAFEKLSESLRLHKITTEIHGARITAVKADHALKIHLLQKDMANVQTKLSAIRVAAPPANAPSAGQGPNAQILVGVAQPRDAEVVKEIKGSNPLPPAMAQSPARAAVTRDSPQASTPPGEPSIAPPNQSETAETKAEIPKTSPTTTRTNVGQPSANKTPAIPMLPRAMERLMPVRGRGKENKPCDGQTRMTQEDKKSKPGAGQSPDVSQKLSSMASPKKAQLGTGLASKISALPKPRKSLLPAARKSFLSGLAKSGEVTDGSESNEVKTAESPPGGSETQTKKPMTFKIAAIMKPRASVESTSSRIVEKESPTGMPESSSLAPLDAALQAMDANGNDLLTQTPALDGLSDDLSYSDILVPIPPTKWSVKNESLHVPPKQRNLDVRRQKSPLKPTLATPAGNLLAGNDLPASSSLVALDAAVQKLQGDRSILTFVPVPGVDFSYSATPVLPRTRLPFKRESIYVSPVRAVVKPSRRL